MYNKSIEYCAFREVGLGIISEGIGLLRISVELAEAGMELGKTIYDLNGRTILASGVRLTDKHLSVLKKWEVRSICVNDPIISLPPIDEVVEEETRMRATQMIKSSFEKTKSTGIFKLTNEQKAIVDDIIVQIIRKRFSITHLAQIQQHDDNLFAHSINVALLSTMTAVALGSNNSQDLYSVGIGAMLHDIGKIAVPPSILHKNSKGSAEDVEIYENHTSLGFQILRRTDEIPLLACHIAYQHHERMDGKGFPRKLDSKNINRLARIVSIANAYDNLIADKADARGISPHHAYENIISRVDSEFDPEVMQAFLSCVSLYPIGSMIRLSSGQIAVVASITAKMQHRPVLKVISDEYGKALNEPYMLDLTDKNHLTLFIDEVLDDKTAVSFLKATH